MDTRNYNTLDEFVISLDKVVRTVFDIDSKPKRKNPGDRHTEAELSESERLLSERLMRVNHSGEVAAQALYKGQGVSARQESVATAMKQAAKEESDHLCWCSERVNDLSGHTSYLNPLWFAGSFTIGLLAGIAGDKWSLGFIAETENQVVRHLDDHLQRLPEADHKSRAILEQMRTDESRHATVALESGGIPLPEPVRKLMGVASKVMTRTAFWL